jgi:CRP/FNR family transcriptional regulator, cyclic AMP receptor protein
MPDVGSKPFDLLRALSHAGQGRAIELYKQRQPIFSQGDPADSVFYIQEGQVTLTVISRHGKEAVVSILGPADVFGEGCLAGQPLRTSAATAIIRSSLLRVDREAMMRLLRSEPEFSEYFISYLLTRNARLQEGLVDQLFNSSEKRLARVLLSLCRLGNGDEKEIVVPKISQQVLADMVGTTRSRVSYFMNKFRKQGFILYRHRREFRINTPLLNGFLRD